ncbi:MFS transporter, sugar porter (SP) family [Halogranum amylolyticum]|uniref:MFS transporter, sugar porter (SP) family n=1 Tax=Halogranum amylolyticum TaxID=660520 RepID=A0A1H8TNX2_9EURY|nr:sugar porter family MFS transporter [Halogranum amylolyticum]SEO92536.1 MFS transporter, sugar porter (SP) family [Halogranum amylolyticum]
MSNEHTSQPASGASDTFIYVAAALAALNGLLFGFDTGVISGAFLYIQETFTMSSFVESVVVSGALVGAVFGAAVGGRLADRIGRRRLILVGAAVFFVGSFIMAVAPTVEILIVGRIIDGVAIGFASMVGPLYISEISPPKIRGSLVSLNQLAVTMGILVSYFVNYAFADGPILALAQDVLGAAGWRWMLGAGMVPALILGVAMLWMPESPRWLVEKGREQEARNVLSRTRSEQQIGDEISEIKETARKQSGTGLSDLTKSWLRPALVVGVGLAAFQQVTGINTVIYYAPTILESTGFNNSASILATVGIGVVNVGMTVVAVLLMDRLGRRPLLLTGLAGMSLTLTALGVAFFLPGLSGVVGWAALVSLMFYVAFFAIGLGPVFWLMISEIYPLKVRGTAMGVVTVVNWAANLLVALTFLQLIDVLGQSWTFWLYAGLSVAALVFTYYLVPETKGRSLEEIEADLRESALGSETTGDAFGSGSSTDDD